MISIFQKSNCNNYFFLKSLQQNRKYYIPEVLIALNNICNNICCRETNAKDNELPEFKWKIPYVAKKCLYRTTIISTFIVNLLYRY